MKSLQRILVYTLCLVFVLASLPPHALASGINGGYTLTDLMADSVQDWLAGFSGQNKGVWNAVDPLSGMLTGVNKPAASSKPQKYYTTPTSSVEDKYGNVTNYYRGGDTTNTQIIDSYNKTFNTIHNTTNNTTTNNYKANVRLENFLNNYTTNNNNYTYSADFKSWYYDTTTNNYNYNQFTKNDYTQNNLYYNQDNSRYYISIDNSTDEYYLVDVQYSPTFVTVNYTYNTTNVKYDKDVGDVTNVYYYELKDGRNSSTLTAAEVAGMDFGYDVANYELVTDDPNTLSLQHFDGDYSDSSSYNRSLYSQNRSTNYVDSGAFGKAVSLPNGSAAGVTIPNLSGYDNLSFDFRVYYSDISKLGIYFGDTNIFQEVPLSRIWKGKDVYSDDGLRAPTDLNLGGFKNDPSSGYVVDKVFKTDTYYSLDELYSHYSFTASSFRYNFPSDISSYMTVPTSYLSAGYEDETGNKYGWLLSSSAPFLYSTKNYADFLCYQVVYHNYDFDRARFKVRHYTEYEYRWSPSQYVLADFSYDSYKNQWVSMRITIANGQLYYFVNGDLVGSGSFTKPAADKFYIKSTGTVYLDELRVTTGSLSSTGSYNPSNAPYDTNKVLALPDKLVANTIYVQHTTPVVDHRIGGVRPSNPVTGFFYIPLHEDYTGGQPQLYDGGNWVNVTAMVYDGSTLKNAQGFQFSPVGSSPDIDVDAKPERPPKPDTPVDPETCTHEWEKTGGTEPTCSLPGTVESTCSKCGKTKTESVPKLSHVWEVKQTVQTSYDEAGNILTQGFIIYRCSLCGEEYKDTDGTGPPNTPGIPSDPDDPEESIWDKIADFVGSVFGGILDLLGSILGGILDDLVSLCTKTLESLKNPVDLFGSFGDALGVLWTWLPPEIMLVLVTGVTIFVFVSLLKLFMK